MLVDPAVCGLTVLVCVKIVVSDHVILVIITHAAVIDMGGQKRNRRRFKLKKSHKKGKKVNGSRIFHVIKYRAFPELIKGIRVQYKDKDIKTRVETISSRSGTTITVINALKEKKRIELDRVIGYWHPVVKASPNNIIRINKKSG